MSDTKSLAGGERSDVPGAEIVVRNGGAVTATEGPGALLTAMLELARDPNFDPAKLQVLAGMQERLEDRQAEREFNIALNLVQQEMPQVDRLGTVDLGKGKGSYAFARLEDIDTVLRPIMIRHGFSIHFDRVQRERDGGGLVVTGTLSHVAGHSKTASFPVALDSGPGRNNLQAAGSADSYARRYILEGFFNIVRKSKDDDGVDADKKYITEEQCSDLRDLLKLTGRQEGPFLDQLFAGAIRSVEEIEIGSGYLAARSTLEALKRRMEQRQGAKSDER